MRIYVDRWIVPNDVHRANLSISSGERSAFIAPRFDPVDRAILLASAGTALDPDVRYRADIEGIRDLELHAIEPFTLVFETAEVAAGETFDPPGYAEVAPIFAECARCHGPPEPVLGLDLSSGQRIRETAIGVAAEEARVGVQGDRAWHGAGRLAGLARIDVASGMGRPSHSYLLYKLMGDPHPEEPLSREQLRLVSDWILGGAPTE